MRNTSITAVVIRTMRSNALRAGSCMEDMD